MAHIAGENDSENGFWYAESCEDSENDDDEENSIKNILKQVKATEGDDDLKVIALEA